MPRYARAWSRRGHKTPPRSLGATNFSRRRPGFAPSHRRGVGSAPWRAWRGSSGRRGTGAARCHGCGVKRSAHSCLRRPNSRSTAPRERYRARSLPWLSDLGNLASAAKDVAEAARVFGRPGSIWRREPMAVHSVPSWTECGIAEGQSLGDGRMTVPARRLETRLRDERERDVDPELSPGAARIVFLRRESPLARIGGPCRL
jgi:hypothetical protein